MESRWRRLLFLYLLGPFQLSSIYLKETALFQIFLERLYVMDYLLFFYVWNFTFQTTKIDYIFEFGSSHLLSLFSKDLSSLKF